MTKQSFLFFLCITLFSFMTNKSVAQEKTILIKKSEGIGLSKNNQNNRDSIKLEGSKVSKTVTVIVDGNSAEKEVIIEKNEKNPVTVKMMVIKDGNTTRIETDQPGNMTEIVKNIEIRRETNEDSIFITIDSLVTEERYLHDEDFKIRPCHTISGEDINLWKTDPINKAVLGVMIDDTDEGVVITDFNEGSTAEKAGFRRGDVILQVNNRYVFTGNGLLKALNPYNPGDKVKVTCLRDGKKVKATVPLQRNR